MYTQAEGHLSVPKQDVSLQHVHLLFMAMNESEGINQGIESLPLAYDQPISFHIENTEPFTEKLVNDFSELTETVDTPTKQSVDGLVLDFSSVELELDTMTEPMFLKETFQLIIRYNKASNSLQASIGDIQTKYLPFNAETLAYNGVRNDAFDTFTDLGLENFVKELQVMKSNHPLLDAKLPYLKQLPVSFFKFLFEEEDIELVGYPEDWEAIENMFIEDEVIENEEIWNYFLDHGIKAA